MNPLGLLAWEDDVNSYVFRTTAREIKLSVAMGLLETSQLACFRISRILFLKGSSQAYILMRPMAPMTSFMRVTRLSVTLTTLSLRTLVSAARPPWNTKGCQ